MKLLAIILVVLFALLHPVLALAVLVAACGVLGILINRAAAARVYPSPGRSA